MTEKESKSKKRGAADIKKSSDGGYIPFPIKFIDSEVAAGKVSHVLAVVAGLHVNDILHQAGLITDDCWNDVKGLLTNTQVLTMIGNLTQSMTTLVEAGTKGAERLMPEPVKPPSEMEEVFGDMSAEKIKAILGGSTKALAGGA